MWLRKSAEIWLGRKRSYRMAAIKNRLDGHQVDMYIRNRANFPRSRCSTPDWTALMHHWPKSWAGIPDDLPIGKQFVELLGPFVAHLQHNNLAPKTIRRHVDNLWCIGGEIIRDLHLYQL